MRESAEVEGAVAIDPASGRVRGAAEEHFSFLVLALAGVPNNNKSSNNKKWYAASQTGVEWGPVQLIFYYYS